MAEANSAGEIINDPLRQAASAPTQAGTTADQVIAGTLAEGERQPWWPEGVNSEQDLRDYVSALSKPQAGEEEGATLEESTEDKPPAEDLPAVKTDDEIRASLKEAGGVYADPKYEPFAIEVEKTGKLSDESVTAAAAAFGVPEDYVKAFVDGQMAQRQLQESKAQGAITAAQQATAATINSVFTGDTGPADYEAMMHWGMENLSTDEKTAYDSAMDRGDQATVKALLGGYRTRWQAEGNGSGRRDITQSGSVTQAQPPADAKAVKPFASLQEGRAQMQTRKYHADPAFRAAVDARYAITE